MTESVLLTGANGFLGKHIYKFLLAKYSKVETLGRQQGDTVKFDFENESAPILDHYDLVVHSAGKAHVVPKTEAEKALFYKINLEGTERLLKGLEKSPPACIIFISTIAVYGLDSGTEIKETEPLNATEPYGDSKKLAEKAIIEWCNRNGCRYGIVRLPLIVGIDPPGNLGAMIKEIKLGRYFRIGNGQARKSMVLADDAAQLIPKLAEIGGIYNLTDGNHPSFKELEDLLGKRLNRKIKVVPHILARLLAYVGDTINFIASRRAFPLDSRAFGKITSTLVLDDSHARDKLGWKPTSILEFIDKNIR